MKFCIADYRTNPIIINRIEALGFEILLMPPNPQLPKRYNGHPDLSLCRISQNEIIYTKSCDERFLMQLQEKGLHLIAGTSEAGGKYPRDIRYNALVIGKYLVHKLNSTDSQLLEEAKKRQMVCLHVNQGYTCCSTAVVRKDIAITADPGICNVLKETGEIQVLKIPPQSQIQLSPGEYGFIGGAGGRIDDTHFAVLGNARLLDSYDEIQRFLDIFGVQLVSLSADKPFDLGTLMFFTL